MKRPKPIFLRLLRREQSRARSAAHLKKMEKLGIIPVLREVDETTVFGYFGELGYGLVQYLPFLNFLSSRLERPIVTASVQGSSPFFNFSDNHLELDVVPMGGHYGHLEDVIDASRALPAESKLFAPHDRPGSIELPQIPARWETSQIERNNIGLSDYKNLEYGLEEVAEIDPLLDEIGPYVLISLKRHFNWGNPDIPNFYSPDEVSEIVETATRRGFHVLLNQFPAPVEATSTPAGAFDFSRLERLPGVTNLAEVYTDNLASNNAWQLRLLRRASHVFASQGGGGILAGICNPSVTILMRGGKDWPLFQSIFHRYGTKGELIFELSQSTWLRNNNAQPQ